VGFLEKEMSTNLRQQSDSSDFLKSLFRIVSEDLLQDFYCVGYTETKKCKDCDHEVKKSIKKRNSMFYINKAESIQEACNNRFKENIPGYDCPKCNNNGRTNIQGCENKIEFDSKNIILALTYPTLMREMKIDPNFRCIVNGKSYYLKSIAVHYGGEHSGHYIALVNKDNKWFVCNDSSVTLCGDIQQYLSSSNVKFIVYSQIDNDIVMAERNIKTMLMEIVKAIDEKEGFDKMQLQKEWDAIRKERDAIQKEKEIAWNEIRKERDAIQKERDAIQKENEIAWNEIQKEKEIAWDAIQKEKERINIAWDALQKEKDGLNIAWDALQKEKVGLNAEKSEGKSEKKLEIIEINQLEKIIEK